MGFDLYGLKPENTVKPDEPDYFDCSPQERRKSFLKVINIKS